MERLPATSLQSVLVMLPADVLEPVSSMPLPMHPSVCFKGVHCPKAFLWHPLKGHVGWCASCSHLPGGGTLHRLAAPGAYRRPQGVLSQGPLPVLTAG